MCRKAIAGGPPPPTKKRGLPCSLWRHFGPGQLLSVLPFTHAIGKAARVIYPQFSPMTGASAKPVWLALGVLFIKQQLGLSDAETVAQIRETHGCSSVPRFPSQSAAMAGPTWISCTSTPLSKETESRARGRAKLRHHCHDLKVSCADQIYRTR
jgi:hypothetical protein